MQRQNQSSPTDTNSPTKAQTEQGLFLVKRWATKAKDKTKIQLIKLQRYRRLLSLLIGISERKRKKKTSNFLPPLKVENKSFSEKETFESDVSERLFI